MGVGVGVGVGVGPVCARYRPPVLNAPEKPFPPSPDDHFAAQARMLARQFVTEHTQQGSPTPATALSNHRLLASVAAWGEDVELAAAWVST